MKSLRVADETVAVGDDGGEIETQKRVVGTGGDPHPLFVAEAGVSGGVEIGVGLGPENEGPLVGDNHKLRVLARVRVLTAAEVEGAATADGTQKEPGPPEAPIQPALDHGGHIPLDKAPGVVVDHVGHRKGGAPLCDPG